MMLFSRRGPSEESHEYVEAFIEFYARRTGATAQHRRTKVFLDGARSQLLDDIYKNLDTIDGKANALLTYCGIMIAASALLLSMGRPPWLQVVAIGVVLLFSCAAALLAMTVLHVHWTAPDQLGQRTLEEACQLYVDTRRSRTTRYLWAWSIMFTTTLATVVGLAVYAARGAGALP